MTEHSGLSRLADIAHREITGGDGPYPVKRKGERRRLDPNWTAIAWLEANTLDATQIIYTADLEPVGMPGMLTLMAAGKRWALGGRTSQCRRMIDVFGLERSSSHRTSYTPCPDCDNFAVSWNCPEHPEGGKADQAPLFGETEGFSIPSVFADELNRIEERIARIAERASWLPDGLATITFQVHDSITPVLGELSGMTYREWREENGIA